MFFDMQSSAMFWQQVGLHSGAGEHSLPPHTVKTFRLLFEEQSYLLDVALDELWSGHLLGGQTLFQL